jgi:hypothetical protein
MVAPTISGDSTETRFQIGLGDESSRYHDRQLASKSGQVTVLLVSPFKLGWSTFESLHEKLAILSSLTEESAKAIFIQRSRNRVYFFQQPHH